jgi:xanthine dehydrogenase YagS FAD-binding subunit
MGALTTNTEVAWHPLVREKFPVLSEALLAGATPQLRNMATIGGNMLQRTRCPYFYDIGTPCNKREPGTGCSAIPGWHRLHAIFGTSEHCIAAHPSDLSVALAALDARVHTIGIAGECEIAFTDLHCQPGETPQIETVLRAGELITAVTIPPLSWARYSHYRKVRDRASYDFALVSAAVALHIDHGMIRDARIALGGVGTKPWRAYPAEQALTGRPAEPATVEEAGKAATDGAKPGADNAFKVELTRHTVAVALRELVSA